MKTIDSNISTQFSSDSVVPYFAVSATFNAVDVLRIWSGYGDITISGNTYTGAGDLLSISQVEESAELKASGVSITISGVPQAILTYALDAQYQNKEIIIYIGVLDKTTFQPSGSPYILFSGVMDIMTINDSASTLSIGVSAESKMIILQRSKSLRYTNEEQKRLFPNDKGLEYVSSLQDKPLIWGAGGSVAAFVSNNSDESNDYARDKYND
tara:strand:+ start:837 stop:1472 length:636 start_codon:yes stop_codon:yes gene_type:complete